MVPDFFAVEILVFTLQLSNFLPDKSCCVATSKARGHDRVRCNGRKTAIGKVGGMLTAISRLCIRVCTRAGASVYVCVCLSLVISISSKVSHRSLDLDILQVLVCLLALLRIFVDIFQSRYTACHSLGEQWGKFEFQLTDKGRFIVIQFEC